MQDYRISGLLSDAKVMLTSENSVQDLTGICHGVSSHTSYSSVPAQSVHSAIKSIGADAQYTESKIEKYPGSPQGSGGMAKAIINLAG